MCIFAIILFIVCVVVLVLGYLRERNCPKCGSKNIDKAFKWPNDEVLRCADCGDERNLWKL